MLTQLYPFPPSIPLGTKVGLGPAQVTLCYMGTQLLPKRGTAPNFWPMSVVAKRSPISATAEHLSNAASTELNAHIYDAYEIGIVRNLWRLLDI